MRSTAGFACLLLAAALAACGVEYHRGKSGADSARAVAALDSARRAERRVDTVTVVRVDTVLVRDTLPPFGTAPPGPGLAGAAPAGVDSFRVARRPDAASAAPSGAPVDTTAPTVTAADLAELGARGVRVPVEGVRAGDVPDTFNERRDGGSRPHQALDLPAPRGTMVLSAADGRVLKLYESAAGGHTVYVADPSGRWVYYYAHLDAYRPGLAEGQPVRAGETLGTVGSSGNASPAAPHLHFAVARLGAARRWWAGTPVDPKPYLR